MQKHLQPFDKTDSIRNNGLLNSANQLSVAPMLDWTNKHCRYFHRQLTCHAWLYSEMVTTGAIIYGNNLERFLGHNPEEEPVVLQLGGSNSVDLAKCAKLGEAWGYSEINLNIGCPSVRVQNNMIGACLMGYPKLVAKNIAAMKAVVDIPVTVKTRIGIDNHEDFSTLRAFVAGLVDAGVDGVIIHARKAWLQGLSPKENRDTPPLNYNWVHRIKQEFLGLSIAINGGIKSIEQGKQHFIDYEGLPAVDGLMLGRIAYEQPYLLSQIDTEFYGQESAKLQTRADILDKMMPYIEKHLTSLGNLNQVTRHMHGLFHGMPGGKVWRRYLSENAFKPNAGVEVLETAYQLVTSQIERVED